MLQISLQKVSALRDSYEQGKVLKDGIRTALCGRPNVGKSSLMNRLAGEDRSIVTAVAGTTRDTVTETVVFGGVKLLLTDTAGIRETADEVEKIGVDRARKAMEQAELILCVFGETLSDEDRMIAEKALQHQGKSVFLFNKSDLGERPLPAWATAPSFAVSAKSGAGMREVEEFIQTRFAYDFSAETALISNARQYQCLCRIHTALSRALDNLALTPDVIVSDLEEALSAVGELTGQTVSEEVVHEIFSRFCVGK
jgi:tRNA modification GTPase